MAHLQKKKKLEANITFEPADVHCIYSIHFA